MSAELDNFINGDFWKYAIITREAYDNDELAKAITSKPRSIGEDYIALSIARCDAQSFADYAASKGFEFEFEFVEGSGKISLLNHAQAINLAFEYDKKQSEAS